MFYPESHAGQDCFTLRSGDNPTNRVNEHRWNREGTAGQIWTGTKLPFWFRLDSNT
jgi:hypothetical protein